MPPSIALRGPAGDSPPRVYAILPPVRLDAFEGPLDLLLHLVRVGRMDIFDLPILLLCDQYIGYLGAMEALDLNIAGDFLVMAATLLEIKSRLLLPAPPRDETDDESESGEFIDPRAELVQRLLEYGKYQSIAEALRGAEADQRMVFFRAPTEYSGAFAAPPRFGEMSAESLFRTLERILQSVGAGERALTSVRRQKITLRMKMREVLGQAHHAAPDGALLHHLLPTPPFALLEIILVFLALLELMKIGSILVAQEEFCGEIRIFFVPENERAALTSVEMEEGLVTNDDAG